jgi:hypothetical protein
MDYYTPTMRLRFVEREEESVVDAHGMILPRGTVRVVKRRVLQQLWAAALQGEDNEWRDVPLVYE